ncbi:hypothetical protein RND59_09050 [Vibrio ruber]|uniref:hypothetical protein n=1 Tax=Vibrio ruber TaxID=184755 RepID=UPI0028936534|nr:hypothetical protein [Vibrio ruber]WNJ94315.1 hypothetical protein RND59_09050 [Vibrio ruber]
MSWPVIGWASTSLHPVQISDNNYVDVRLLMEDYPNNTELPPASTKVLHYRSAEFNHLPNDARTLVNTFRGSTGLARILTLDTNEHFMHQTPSLLPIIRIKKSWSIS